MYERVFLGYVQSGVLGYTHLYLLIFNCFIVCSVKYIFKKYKIMILIKYEINTYQGFYLTH